MGSHALPRWSYRAKLGGEGEGEDEARGAGWRRWWTRFAEGLPARPARPSVARAPKASLLERDRLGTAAAAGIAVHASSTIEGTTARAGHIADRPTAYHPSFAGIPARAADLVGVRIGGETGGAGPIPAAGEVALITRAAHGRAAARVAVAGELRVRGVAANGALAGIRPGTSDGALAAATFDGTGAGARSVALATRDVAGGGVRAIDAFGATRGPTRDLARLSGWTVHDLAACARGAAIEHTSIVEERAAVVGATGSRRHFRTGFHAADFGRVGAPIPARVRRRQSARSRSSASARCACRRRASPLRRDPTGGHDSTRRADAAAMVGSSTHHSTRASPVLPAGTRTPAGARCPSRGCSDVAAVDQEKLGVGASTLSPGWVTAQPGLVEGTCQRNYEKREQEEPPKCHGH